MALCEGGLTARLYEGRGRVGGRTVEGEVWETEPRRPLSHNLWPRLVSPACHVTENISCPLPLQLPLLAF